MPEIRFSKIAVVSGNGVLAESICAAFRQPGVYVPLFESPDGFNDDFGLLGNACIRLANILRRLKPSLIYIVGCSLPVRNRLLPLINSIPILLIENSINDHDLRKQKGYRKISQRWAVQEFGTDIKLPQNGNLIVVEKGNELALVLTRNLAMATGSHLVLIDKMTQEEAHEAKEFYYKWSTGEFDIDRHDSKLKLFEILRSRLKSILNVNAETISFVSHGIPFGILPFLCPTTHYFSFPGQLGLSIMRGIMKTVLGYPRVPLAILCDPSNTGTSEFKEIRKILGKEGGYTLRNAYRENAKAFDASMLTEYVPCDFIIYSTHAGEQSGERITELFKTPDGFEHRICYERAISFNPTHEKDLFQVNIFKRWITIDDAPWPSEESRQNKQLANAFQHYMNCMKKDDHCTQIIESTDIGPIRSSDSFGMSDFNFTPSIHNVGADNYPLVFSNACSSWREMVNRFSVAGASVYIGTALDIPNPIALEVAPKLIRRVAEGHTIGYSLFRAQKEFIGQLGYTPYLLHGFIFMKLKPVRPFQNNLDKVRTELRNEWKKWKDATKKPRKEEESLTKRIASIAEFLKSELTHFNNPGPFKK